MTYKFKLSRRFAQWWAIRGRQRFGLVLILLLVGWYSPALPGMAAVVIAGLGNGLSYLFHHQFPPILTHGLVVWFGAFATQTFRFLREIGTAKETLREIFPNRTDMSYARLDLFVTPVMGAILGTIIVNPVTAYSSLLTGLGWPILVRGAIGAIRGITERGGGGDGPSGGSTEVKLFPVPRTPNDSAQDQEESAVELRKWSTRPASRPVD